MCDAPHFCTLQTHVKLAWDISVHKAQGKLHVCNVWVMLLCSCERGPISQTVVFQGGFFCLGRSFPFPSLIGFFPSFC
jgi:hypothetical protein